METNICVPKRGLRVEPGTVESVIRCATHWAILVSVLPCTGHILSEEVDWTIIRHEAYDVRESCDNVGHHQTRGIWCERVMRQCRSSSDTWHMMWESHATMSVIIRHEAFSVMRQWPENPANTALRNNRSGCEMDKLERMAWKILRFSRWDSCHYCLSHPNNGGAVWDRVGVAPALTP